MNELYLLYTMLLENCPVDTRNMISHITINYFDGYCEIKIEAPSNSGDYARYVNYNQQRSAKEIQNFKWVERTLEQWSNIVGGNIEYELY